jgi:hypothetical protein
MEGKCSGQYRGCGETGNRRKWEHYPTANRITHSTEYIVKSGSNDDAKIK